MNRIERLEKVLNETSGNPYHDSEGKFTFSPSSFKNTSGKDAEVTDNPRDWYLTDLSRKNINKVPEISSTKELKDYLSSNGIKSDIDNPSIKKHEDYENIEFDALKKQASGIVASVEFCKAVFGKESLSKLKEIKFYSSETETTGSFDVMLKGEKPSKTNGTLELSTDITNRGILHEFIHVVQDSTKRKSQDAVLWSKEILDKTGVNSKAYTGANKNHLAAEQLADLISFGIANGKNLEDVSKVINYIRKNKTENSIQLNGGPGSGNLNPGQGRGVGKPSKKISYEEYVEKFKKSTRSEKRELDEKYPEYADKYFDELMGRHLKTLKREREQKELEEKFKNYENDNSHPHFDLDNMVYEYKNALDITPDEYNGDWNDETKSFEKLKNLKEYYNKKKGIQVRIVSMNPADYSRTIIDNDGEHYTSMSVVKDRTSKEGINMYKEKFKNGERVEIPYIKFDENGKFSGEQEGFHRTLAANEIGDSEIPVAIVTKYYGKQPKFSYGRDITKKVEKYFANKKENNSRLNRLVILENRINDKKSSRGNKLNKALNSQEENLDYRYDVKAYKEYLKEWLKHKDEKEYLDGGVLSFAEFWEHDIDYEFEDYKKILKLIDEYNKKKELVTNGGPNSGNHNPGQGRGMGKPANGHASHSGTQYSAKNYLSKKEYENIVSYSSDDNFTEEELDAIAGYTKSMGYGASCDLNQAIRENDFGEIIERENVIFPEDDSQIVTWKENKEFIEQKIKDKKKYDSLSQEIQLAASVLRKGGLSDEKETEKLKAYVSDIQKERDNLSKTLKYSEYENYIKNYEKGLYKDLKDDQKMWTINEDKLSKISVVKLREKQKSDPKRFDEVLEIPRLMWSMYYDDKPTTTDTLANKYQRDFKDLDKLDNIIKNKGFVLDKDITVTRRVANAKVIENQIKNKGEYTQNGITSVTAAKSIGKKMPSGVHMGNDLLRITIPAGTRVISTYNPFVRDTQKSADKYNGGKLSEEDNRNLRMIKGQNELILPSGSKFVSPNGNSISKNEDGSYQLILKTEEGKTNNSRAERLNFLQKIFNGGKGSGNPNPGQGRGIGKPSNKYSKNNTLNKIKNKFSFSPETLEYIEKNASDEFIKTLDKVSEEVKNEGIDISDITILYDKNLLKKRILAKAGVKADGTKRLTLSPGLIKEKNQDFLGSKTYHTDTTIEGVLRHEFGHIKIYQLVDKLKWATKDRKYSASEIEYAIAMKSSKIENILDFPKISNKDMSEYGITSAAEFCAESFSNKEYSQMTKDAYKIMTNPDKVAEVLKEFSSTAQKEGVKIINSKNNYKDICVGYFVSKKDYDNYMKSRIERLNFLQEIFNGANKGNPYHDKFGRFTSAGSTTSSSTLYYDSDTTLGDASKSGDITKDIKSFKDFKDRLNKVEENYNGYLIEGQEVWVSPESKLFKKTESPVTDENVLKMRKEEIEKENKSPFVLVSTFKNKDVIVDGNHVAAAYRELSEEGKNYLVPILYVERKEIERFEKENPDYHDGKKVYTKTKLIDEK